MDCAHGHVENFLGDLHHCRIQTSTACHQEGVQPYSVRTQP